VAPQQVSSCTGKHSRIARTRKIEQIFYFHLPTADDKKPGLHYGLSMMTARAPAFIFVFITIALDMLSIGIIIPVLPKLIESFMVGDTASAARMVGIFSTTYAVMQFFASPVLGALSDKFGRRPVMLLSNLGLGIDYILTALSPNLWWLFIGRLIAGVTSASASTAGAYIADVTAPENRAQKFGMLGAAFGLGFVIGPAIGGILGNIDLHYPFWVAAIMSIINFAFGYFVLPESLKPENRSAFSWAKANPVASIKLLLRNRQLWSFGSAIFLSQIAHTVLPSIYVLYAGFRYGWGPAEMGWLLTAVGIASMIVQGTLVRPIVRKIGERPAALIGLIAGGTAMIWYGTAWHGWLVWFGVPIAAFWGLFNATSQAIMSKNVTALEQGKLQGANMSLVALADIIGPALFAFTFAAGIDPKLGWDIPGIAFWLAGSILFAACAITWWVTTENRA
jgi:MFS transporter, DHA1 family, tetracycline resistance protein